MTHDELLAKINYDIEGNPYDEYMSAIRAVVELHKPIKYRTPLKIRTGCNVCENNLRYPCETIQAIEKELE